MARIMFGLGLAIVAVGLATYSYRASEAMATGESGTRSTAMAPGIVDYLSTTYPVPGAGPQQVDVFHPKAGKSVRRGIVLIHGGGWVGGSRQDMYEIARRLAADGFTGFCIDY